MIAIIPEGGTYARVWPPVPIREGDDYSEEEFVHIWVPNHMSPPRYVRGLPYLCGCEMAPALGRKGYRFAGNTLRPLTKEIWKASPYGRGAVPYEKIKSYSRAGLCAMLWYLGYKVFTGFDVREEGDHLNEEHCAEYWMEIKYVLSPLDPQFDKKEQR